MKVGSMEWGRKTQGKISFNERLQFLPIMLKSILTFLFGRLRLLIGLRARQDSPSFNEISFPQTVLAKKIEEYCCSELSHEIVNHSYRTYVFAWAISRIDRIEVDLESLFIASMMHDICLEKASSEKCFALVSGETCEQAILDAGGDGARALVIGDAVAMHLNPNLDPHEDSLSYLIAHGALLDISGNRVWELSREFIDRALDRYPRLNMKHVMAGSWKAQVKAFPSGRAAFIELISSFSIITKFAPFSS